MIFGTGISFLFSRLKADGHLACANCNGVYYCDKVCQRNAWKSHHKIECEYFRHIPDEVADIKDPFLKAMFRKGVPILMVRTILKLSQGCQDEFVLPNGKKRRFSDLMSHKEEMNEDGEIMNSLRICYGLFHKWLRHKVPSFDEFIEIFGKIKINSAALSASNQDLVVACGLYLGYSAIDHSCAPNAHWYNDGTELILRTMEDVQHFSDLRITYLGRFSIGTTSDERKKKLKGDYYFDCKCSKCEDPNSDAKLMSLICKKCDGWVYIEFFICSNCSRRNHYKDHELKIIQEFKSGTLTLPEPRYMRFKEIAKLFNKYSRIFHPSNKIFGGKTFDSDLSIFLRHSDGLWYLFKIFELKLIHLYEHHSKLSKFIYNHEMEMSDVCFSLYKSLNKNWMLKEATLHLEKAEEICKVGIGSKASVGKIALKKIEQKKMSEMMAQIGNVSI